MNHPVPTVQSYKTTQDEYKSQADEYAAIVEKRRVEMEERDAQRQRQREQEQEDDSEKEINQNTTEAAHSAAGAGVGGLSSNASGNKVEELQNPEGNAAKNAKDRKEGATANSGTTEKARMMDQMNSNQMKPTDRIKKADKGERRVRDPTTGGEIVVKDADPKDFDTSHPRTTGHGPAASSFPRIGWGFNRGCAGIGGARDLNPHT